MLAFALVAGGAGVAAQTRLVGLLAPDLINCQKPCRGSLLDIDVEQRRVAANPPVSEVPSNFVRRLDVTADGQLAIFIFDSFGPSPKILRGVDLTSFAEFSVPLGVNGARSRVFAHPARVMAFVQASVNEPIMVADHSGMRPLPNPQGVQHEELTGMSGDGTRLFIYQFNRQGSSVVIDSETGAVVAVFGDLMIVASNDAGTEVYGVTVSDRTTSRLKRIDVATGAVLAESVAGYSDSFARNPRTGDIWGGSASGHLLIRNGATLEIGAVVLLPQGYLAFDPDRPFAYIAGKPSPEAPVHVAMVNTDTFAVEAEGDVPVPGTLLALGLVPRPPRVSDLSSTVLGSTVTLGWTVDATKGVATEILLEAGSAPGRTDIARLRAAAGSTSLTVPNVPPGTYFVRVRSLNGAGAGTPSNEVVVIVPAQ